MVVWKCVRSDCLEVFLVFCVHVLVDCWSFVKTLWQEIIREMASVLFRVREERVRTLMVHVVQGIRTF